MVQDLVTSESETFDYDDVRLTLEASRALREEGRAKCPPARRERVK
jgi:hypothetical protein